MKSQGKYRLHFLGAFVLGAIAIIVSTTFSEGLVRVTPVFPGIIMLIYCGLIWDAGRLSEEAGDSLYYLGFAFTLVALIAAMAGTLFNEQEIELRTIVKTFGIALSTTVIGLVGRVFLLSFVDERSGSESQEVAYEDAMSALQELQMQVRETVQTLSEWRRQATEHWRTVREQEMSGMEEVLAAHQEVLGNQAATFQVKLVDAYSDLERYSRDTISKVGTVAVEAIERVKHVAASGTEEMRAFVAAAQEEIEGSFRGVSQQLKQELRKTQEGAEQATESLRSTVIAFQESIHAVQQALQTGLSAWDAEIGKAAESVGIGVSRQIEAGSEKVSEASRELADNVASVAQRLSAVRFDTVNQALEEAQKLIVEGFTALSQKASGLGDQLVASFPAEGEYRTIFDALNSSLVAAVEQNRASMHHMQVAASETAALFAKVGQEVKSVGDAMGFEQVRSSVHSLAQSMDEHREAFATMGETLTRVSGDLIRAGEGISSLATTLENTAGEMDHGQREVNELRRQLSAATEAMAQDLLSSQRALRMVMNTLSEGVQQLRNEIEPGRRR